MKRRVIRIGDLGVGLVIGALGIGIIIMIVLLVQGGGSPEGVGCDDPLPPLGVSPITAAEFSVADLGLSQTVESASTGSVLDARRSFFGRVHNFTHNVDPPLRARDPDIARDLCERVLNIERELALGERPERIAIEAESIRQILLEAQDILGLTSE